MSPGHHRTFRVYRRQYATYDPRIRGCRAENIIGKDCEIRDGRQVVARVSRAWFRLRDTYGVDVAPGENEALMICIAICLDRIHHDEERRR
jgi:uncharacterized protein YxjI